MLCGIGAKVFTVSCRVRDDVFQLLLRSKSEPAGTWAEQHVTSALSVLVFAFAIG
jgi:hypothetical protein